MMRWVIALVAFIALTASVRSVSASVTSSAEISLRGIAPGVYHLDLRSAADLAPLVVHASVFAIGSDNGVVVELARSNDGELTVDLNLPLDGMRGEGCYHVTFWAGRDVAGKPELSQQGPELRTRACVDATGLTTFPEFDGVDSPDPEAPSNVRLVLVPASEYPDAGGDTWTIKWTDNSSDELSFQAQIFLIDKPYYDGGSLIARMDLPEVPADRTDIGSIGFFFVPDAPPESLCGLALVVVAAIGADGSSREPATTVPACFGRGTISFPDAGAGAPANDHLPARTLALVGIGVLLMAAGLTFRHARSLRA